jgi:site-specific DNA-cytosine methylase
MPHHRPEKHFVSTHLQNNALGITPLMDSSGTTTRTTDELEDRRAHHPKHKHVLSFPDNFTILIASKLQWAQIGNSVPPASNMYRANHVRTRKLVVDIE